MRNWNVSPCHIESTWRLWNLLHGCGLGFIRINNPCLLNVLCTVFQCTGRLNWCFILLAPQCGYCCFNLRIRCSMDLLILCLAFLGPVLLGVKPYRPCFLYSLTHLRRVLSETSYILDVSAIDFTPSVYNTTAFV